MRTSRLTPLGEGTRERRALRAFAEVLERVREELDRELHAAAAEIDVFARLLAEQDPDELERRSARSRELERLALVEGEWGGYLNDLREQGALYASLGVGFDAWYALLTPYRRVVVRAVLEDRLDAPEALDELEGLGRFLDIAMATIADAYISTKEARLQQKERVLQRYVRELERSNRELDDFAYVASHDLKAPLRDIHSLAGWVVEDAAESMSDDSRRHLALLTERIERMERLLEDLLQYSRAGRGKGRVEPLDVRDAIAQAADVALPSDGFTLSVTGEAPVIHTARAPLELVLRNLLSNAVKHHDRDEGRIRVAVAEDDELLEIAVTDDGPGIAPELQERCFRMFQTLRPRDEVEGSGMGLATVKKVVEARGGTVGLESTPGEGTTVRFTWPRDERGRA